MTANHITLAGGMAEAAPYSDAVIAGEFIYVAGQLAQDDPAWRGRSGTIEEETRAAMDLIGRILRKAGADYADIVRVGVYMLDLAEFERMNAVFGTYFEPGRRPARTCVGVATLLSGARIEIDCVARIRARQ